MKKHSSFQILSKILFAALFALLLSACGASDGGDGTESYSDTASHIEITAEPPETVSPETSHETASPETTSPETEAPVCMASLTAAVIPSEGNYGVGCDIVGQIGSDMISFSASLISEGDVLSRVFLNIQADGGEFAFSENAVNPDGSINLLDPECKLKLTDASGVSRVYSVKAEYLPLGLPVVSLNTGGAAVGREEYVNGTAKISCEGTELAGLDEAPVRIRGRGHSTWNMMPKKPYKLKFEEKVSVLGMAPAKEWTLLANYADMSLMRNTVVFETAKVADNLGFVPSQYPVNLFINGEYAGVYSIGEQLEVKSGRVELSENTGAADGSFLLEIGGEEDPAEFGVSAIHIACFRWCKIKHPDEKELTSEQVAFIEDYIRKADLAVSAGEGYDEYIDMDSMIDWFIIGELFYNLESCFRRSCYVTKDAGGKLQFGPIWDFDLAVGNLYNDFGEYSSWMCLSQKNGYIEDNWFCTLMNDESFRERLRSRWDEIKDGLLETATGAVDRMSVAIAPSAYYNFVLWPTLGTRSVAPQPLSIVELDTYEKHVSYVRAFIVNRWNWLDANI